MAEQKIDPRLIWTVSILLAVLFAGVGILLIVNPPGNPDESLLLPLRGLGVVMTLGAVLLLVPRLAWVGALVLSAVLVGDIGYLIYKSELLPIVIPALFLISLGSLAYGRRPGGPLSATAPPGDTSASPATPNPPPPSAPTGSGPSVE